MNHRIFIIDTNVLAAGLITTEPESPTAKILDAMLNGSLLYILSSDLLLEYRNVLLRPNLVRYHGLGHKEIDQLLTEITANAIWREPVAENTDPPPDPNDSHLWALLASEPKAILITGDQLLLKNPKPQHSVIPPSAYPHPTP
ncbi:MAG: putative toxin-antitoxin system toxin component, PIN family [Halobacteriales archaeon]|nr:putative toxin-antitoxin system toxin component, PIN family [Halobacteriales archaeon]